MIFQNKIYINKILFKLILQININLILFELIFFFFFFWIKLQKIIKTKNKITKNPIQKNYY